MNAQDANALMRSRFTRLRDNHEASWTQVVDTLEFMADASDLPVLLDGDTGYGNFNNVRRLVRKLEQRGIAGVCIEDKPFPKTNSFICSERQPLAEIDEFCGKTRKHGVNDITVVGGYRADAIDTAGVKLVVNERHAHTGELASLACANDSLATDTAISYGDLLFRSYVLRDFAYCSVPDDRALFGRMALLTRIWSRSRDAAPPHGRWIGLLSIRGAGREPLRAMLDELRRQADFDALDMPALINALIDAGEAIDLQYVLGHRCGVNDLEDFRRAGDFAYEQTPFAPARSGIASKGAR